MKEVIQGNTITLDLRIYNIDPSLGGVPTDPDNYLHDWDIQNDVMGRVSAISLYFLAAWPPNPTYYFTIDDSGADFDVKAYTDVARTILIASTGPLSYGVYSNQGLNEFGGSGYVGAVSITFPGIGGGTEDFEITDLGPTGPTYQIRNEDNTLMMLETIYPTRIAAGHYQTTYLVPSTETPGENWRNISRARVNSVDVYYEEMFRVIDATVATEEAAKLVTLSELKNALEIYDSSKDNFLNALILPASQACEEYLDKKYHVEDNVVIFDGNDLTRIYFNGDGPIYSVQSLEYREGSGAWTAIDAANYTFDGFFLTILEGDMFYKGRSNWQLTYKFGVDRAPAQIRRAVCELVKYWNATKNRGGVLEDTVGSGIRTRYEELKSDLPPVVLQMLNAYRGLV